MGDNLKVFLHWQHSYPVEVKMQAIKMRLANIPVK